MYFTTAAKVEHFLCTFDVDCGCVWKISVNKIKNKNILDFTQNLRISWKTQKMFVNAQKFRKIVSMSIFCSLGLFKLYRRCFADNYV